ncbi:MAG: YraN family protein [Phycisphaerae bacterium]|nr:YraN family protein [Phycisphaerae bacterium]
MPDNRQDLGKRGEQLAERYLRKRGLRTITRRFKTPVGELDLVMRDGDTLVFVEVKTLSDDKLLPAHEHVTAAQRRHLAKAARIFVHRNRWEDKVCRFDVVGVVLPEIGEPTITHVPDAFVPERW